MWYLAVLAGVISYLLGNLNGAVIVSKLFAHDDVRSHGSGNAGLTNFIRNYGVKSALLVIVIDAGKAVLACIASGLLLRSAGYWQEGLVLGGVCVMLGHDFPALLGFKGGKGILSGWFVAWSIDWRIGLLIFVVFATAYLLTQYVSLGSVLAAVTFGVGFAIFHHDNILMLAGGIFMGALTVFMHRGNILRLVKGEERKTNLFGKGKKE
ncbi:MAG: glycerol-3-phosphate acyltransferase [Oscillospiraceae bacterium]|nr:glycerol-3-phosphate acyltransferase [Oscillospiraceae bacterium]